MTTQTKTTWRTVRLGEVVEIIDGDRGENYPGNGELLASGYSVFLNTKNVSGTKFDFNNVQFISEGRNHLLRKGKLERGDFVLTTRGTIGNVAHYGKDIQYEHIRINSGMVILRPKQNIIDERFFNLFLIGQAFKNQTVSLQSGSAQPQLPIRDLKRFEIDLPSFKEQSKISDILWVFDEKIENNNRIIKTLEEMAQAIFKEWFVKFRFPGYEKVKLVDSELGEIPKGWEVKRLGDLGKIITGKTPSTKDKDNFGNIYPFVTIPDLQSGMFVMSTERFLSDQGGESMRVSKLPAGAICVSCIATVGLIGITTQNSFTNQQINSVLPDSQELQTFLFLLLRRMKTSLQSYASGGTAAPIISKGVFEKIPAIVPSENLVENFHKIISPMFEKIKIALEENQKLAAMRDLLLPKLMSGEIMV